MKKIILSLSILAYVATVAAGGMLHTHEHDGAAHDSCAVCHFAVNGAGADVAAAAPSVPEYFAGSLPEIAKTEYVSVAAGHRPARSPPFLISSAA